jgi:hypothetical protein
MSKPGSDKLVATALRAVPRQRNKATNVLDQKAIAALIARIFALDEDLDQSEDAGVTALIAKGLLLRELKTLTKNTWGEKLRGLRIHARVASRLMKIGAWSHKTGLIGSDLIRRLPHELHKLEAIARLDSGVWQRFVQDRDCRRLTRQEVVKAVNETLGRPSQSRESDTVQRLNAAVEKLEGCIENGASTTLDSVTAQMIRDRLNAVLEKLNLQSGA